MTPSVRTLLRTSKARKDGTAPVWIRITANRKSRYLSTGIHLLPQHWNERKRQVRSSHELAAAYNARLQQLLIEAQEQALSSSSALEVKAALVGSGPSSFTGFFQRYIDDLDTAGRFWEWKKYRVTLGKLTDALGASLLWDELDRSALIQFERHLRETCKNNPNTIRKEMQRLRRVIKQAIQEGIIEVAADPFLTYRRPPAKKPNRRKLSLEEVDLLAKGMFAEGTWERWARDAWLFAYYAGGMRFSDVACLRAKNIKEARVSYSMLKTGHPLSIPLPEEALTLLQSYLDGKEPDAFVFPFLAAGDDKNGVHLRRRISSKNVLVNKALKRVAEQVGLDAEGLSMHVARHSFADFARRRSGNLYAISKTMGHRNLATTEQYLKSLDQEAVDELAETLWAPTPSKQ